MGLKEIETPNAMISYFAEQLGPLIEKSEIKQPTYLYWELMRKAGSGNLPELLLANNNINDYLIICLSPFKQRTYLY